MICHLPEKQKDKDFFVDFQKNKMGVRWAFCKKFSREIISLLF
jgi:hypothetical protein